jgi:hypothetical protein
LTIDTLTIFAPTVAEALLLEAVGSASLASILGRGRRGGVGAGGARF